MEIQDIKSMAAKSAKDKACSIKNLNSAELLFYSACLYCYRAYVFGIMQEKEAKKLIAEAEKQYKKDMLLRQIRVENDNQHRRLAELRIQWNKTKNIEVAKQIADEFSKIAL